jgi:hypothetical protein
MDSETDQFGNLCTDLVSLARLEPGLRRLFQNGAGEWISVAELYRAVGPSDEPIKPELAAVWLPSPTGTPGYVVILFCDEDSQWSLTAYYNRGRLLGNEQPKLNLAASPRPAR